LIKGWRIPAVDINRSPGPYLVLIDGDEATAWPQAADHQLILIEAPAPRIIDIDQAIIHIDIAGVVVVPDLQNSVFIGGQTADELVVPIIR
jgi:hypothetical protein